MPINKTLVLIFVWLSPYLDRFLHECSLILRIDDQHLQRSCINISSAIAQYTKGTKVIIFLLEQVWMSIFHIINFKKKMVDTGVLDFLIKN